jgi:hypothetical protein
MKSVVRVANAGGYWGDDPEALYRQVTGGRVDYVTMDFLAEITMVILQRQRARDPKTGYALDFVRQLQLALPVVVERGTTVIVNAGGINPGACADAVEAACREAGASLPIGVVSGDDLMPRLEELEARGVGLDHMDGGRGYDEIRGRVLAANAYIGARPVVEALRRGARIIVTGRTADAALVLAPLVHEFGWAWDDWDRLAAGVIAGHILECGAQATGGNFTDWQRVPSMLDIGYPIAEVEPNGDFVITKHPGTGGMVTRETVTEQLLYEIGDPHGYLTPDVTADFTSLRLSEEGPDRVRVTGVQGTPPPHSLKVSMVYQDGYRAVGTALVAGPHAVAKGERLAEMLWHRVGTDFVDRRVDFVGYRGCWGAAAPEVEPNEIVFRMGVADADRKKIERFAYSFLGFALQAPPGLGVFGGRPEVQPRLGFWPALVPRETVSAVVEVRRQGEPRKDSPFWEAVGFRKSDVSPLWKRGARGDFASDHSGKSPSIPLSQRGRPACALPSTSFPTASSKGEDLECRDSSSTTRVPLHAIAYARSGDKGDHANIGVAARSEAAFPFLRGVLTAQAVKEYYRDLVEGDVVRYELPNLCAFNFVLHNALGGGGTLSLRVDHQGKALAQGLLLMQIEVPDEIVASCASCGW